ncbi:MAG TPA: hypothetical protein VI795_03025 [Patescibacteria group bacterium]|nr:hypothetical protein [Patescibacteria group bacterium]
MSKTTKRKTFKLIGLILLVIGIICGILLVKQSQDVREKAANDNRCTYKGQQCNTSDPDCPGYCYEGLNGDLHCHVPAHYPGGRCWISGVTCNNDEHCLNGRKCQNGKCIGNPNKGALVKQYLDENKCKTDNDCKSGYFCSILKACLSDKWKF